jgi:hypothetical protein
MEVIIMRNINLKRYFAIALSIFMLSGLGIFSFIPQAQAEAPKHGPSQTVKRAPAPQNRNFVDSRFHHNRSYPARGQSFTALPRDHRAVMYGHSRYYSSHGAWYRPNRGRYLVVAPPIGLFVPFLPLAYATIWMHGIPYYYANETYYTQTPGGYAVVEPPQGEISETPPGAEGQTNRDISDDQMFIYPRKGQNEAQQANDRYECHHWSVEQTNFDPTNISPEIPDEQIMQLRSDYQRAMAACLDSRGYTAK